MQTYAIGDIHGHIDLLKGVHDLIANDMARHGAGQVVHVGDLVDRGPDSKGVVDYLRQGIADGQDWVVLKGNHDRMFSLFLDDPAAQDPGLRSVYSWLHPRLGGATTLESYGVANAGDRPVAKVHADALGLVPQAHIDFLANRPTFHRSNGAIFVHAGVRPGIAITDQDEDDLVWIRQGFLDHDAPFEALIVHGHTAIDTPTHYGNRVNIDSSAAYGGPLSVIVVEQDTQVFHLTAKGRVPLLD
ncbi:MAG: metallophosphoesterase [Pseudotabrizicola sp.]|uniref:metallophosphoesterase n=1 Tax=Pseudotabrizicola sp. TaxID=2939647 RepID=UPI002722969D|nr:metallophosphoesterase [Pseudotabrizicola sp.]MDO8884834.1 metallophosphoesterase [Pseudotabrizicola sp.]MDP2082119.1 metallophosphoesterase [Pseudotabrizicola sp.]MDZ7576512.1 metallophosphoesterase [Pseudotabrizicola sp.]